MHQTLIFFILYEWIVINNVQGSEYTNDPSLSLSLSL